MDGICFCGEIPTKTKLWCQTTQFSFFQSPLSVHSFSPGKKKKMYGETLVKTRKHLQKENSYSLNFSAPSVLFSLSPDSLLSFSYTHSNQTSNLTALKHLFRGLKLLPVWKFSNIFHRHLLWLESAPVAVSHPAPLVSSSCPFSWFLLCSGVWSQRISSRLTHSNAIFMLRELRLLFLAQTASWTRTASQLASH